MKKILLVLILNILSLHDVLSQVTVENATDKTVSICIGWIEMKETTKTVYFKTWSEGWWTVGPHTKITIKSDCPTNQSIFYYAKTTDGTGLWEGSPNEYGGGIPDYFRVKFGEAFKIENPKFDTNVKYPANYWKIFRKKDITKGGLFSKPSVNIYLTL